MKLKHLLRLSMSILTVVFAAAAPAAHAAGVLSFPTTSKLATDGHWVKIRCDRPGMQQITYDDLRSWGFPDPSKVRVFGVPASRMFVNNNNYGDFTTPGLPTDLQVMRTLRWPENAPNKLIFYNEGQFAHNVKMDNSSRNVSVKTYVNLYDTSVCYLLTDSRSDVDAIESQGFDTGRSSTYNYHHSLEYTRDMTHHPMVGGALYFGQPWTGNTRQVTIPMTDAHKPTASTAPFTYFIFNVAWPAYSSSIGTYEAKAAVNESIAPFLTQSASRDLTQSPYHSGMTFTEQDGWLKMKFASTPENISEASFTITTTPTNTALQNYPRYHMLLYTRSNILRPEQDQMTMYFDFANISTSKIRFLGQAVPLGKPSTATKEPLKLDGNLQVWDVSYPLRPQKLAMKRVGTSITDTSSFDVTIPTHTLSGAGSRISGTPLVAFRPAAELPRPVYVEDVEPQNLHGLPHCDMLIITTEALLPQAERLAQSHRDLQGLKVNVVTHDQVINEFTAGTRHAMAYRLLSKMFYDRNATSTSTRYRYLLLFGPSVWDNLHTVLPAGDYLLSYETHLYGFADTSGRDFASNDYFGDVDDNVNETNMVSKASKVAVGQIDAYDITEATHAVDKIIGYMTNPPLDADFYNRALYLADSSPSFRNDAITNSDRTRQFQPALTTERLFLDLCSTKPNGDSSLRDLLTDALSEGRYYWNYTGHANPTEFRSSKSLWNAALAASTSYPHAPIGMFGTCDSYRFDHMDGSIVHQMMMNRRGGVIAAVAACRQVYHTQNNLMARGFERALFDRPALSGLRTIGDLYIKAKSNTFSETSTPDNLLYGNTRCYNLAGDPAVPLLVPTMQVLLSEAAAKALNTNPDNQQSGAVTVYPDKPFTLKGFVGADANATQPIADFNGTLYISIFDAPRQECMTYKGSASDSYVYVQTDHVPLLRTAVQVKDGRFETQIVLPSGTGVETLYNRISLMAVRDDSYDIAVGGSKALRLAPYDPEQAIIDTQAPVIEQAYIHTPDFTDGLNVAPTPEPKLFAVATDEGVGFASGYASGTQPLTISIDGKTLNEEVSTAVRPAPGGGITIELPLGNIAPGEHSLTITATDRAGNSSTRSLTFYVTVPSLPCSLSLAESPARQSATFTVDAPDTLVSPRLTLTISDATGSTIRSITGTSMEFNWDLTDHNGRPVPDGTYTAVVQLEDHGIYGASAPTPIIVIR